MENENTNIFLVGSAKFDRKLEFSTNEQWTRFEMTWHFEILIQKQLAKSNPASFHLVELSVD